MDILYKSNHLRSADTLRILIFRPLRAVPEKSACSRLHSSQRLTRLWACFDEPWFCIVASLHQQKEHRWYAAYVFSSVWYGGYSAHLDFSTASGGARKICVLETPQFSKADAPLSLLRRTVVLHSCLPLPKQKTDQIGRFLFWWREVDSNHRSHWQQIYSLPPLATREPLQKKVELVMGLEPATCWLQISCSANWATPALTLLR